MSLLKRVFFFLLSCISGEGSGVDEFAGLVDCVIHKISRVSSELVR